jgi:hypothetical protein
MTNIPRYMDLAAIADRIGVSVRSMRVYHQRAKSNRLGGNLRPGDLPEPDAIYGRTPVWLPVEVEAWILRRPGRGVGGAAARGRSGPKPSKK